MALERSWFSAAQAFTLDGNASGLITVADSAGFYVGQIVQLSSNTQTSVNYKIKRIEGKTKIYVGPSIRQDGQPFHTYANVSNFLVSDLAKIYAAEQSKPTIKPDEWEQNTHEHEPILAKRVITVDQYGNHYTKDNPFPIDINGAQINVDNLDVNVQLTDKESAPGKADYDITRIGDGISELTITKAQSGNVTGVNTVNKAKLFTKPFNKMTVLSKNDDGDPLTIKTQYNGLNVQLATFIYDADGDFVDAEVSDY